MRAWFIRRLPPECVILWGICVYLAVTFREQFGTESAVIGGLAAFFSGLVLFGLVLFLLKKRKSLMKLAYGEPVAPPLPTLRARRAAETPAGPTKICQGCWKTVAADAKACPHCAYVFASEHWDKK